MYGLITAPLATAQLEKLNRVERKMLRLMVGYSKLPQEGWDDMYRRLKDNLAQVAASCQMTDWPVELLKRKLAYYQEVVRGTRCPLVQTAFRWNPKLAADAKLANMPGRKRGRSRKMVAVLGC